MRQLRPSILSGGRVAKRQRGTLAELLVMAAFDESFEARDITALAARLGFDNRTLQRRCAGERSRAKRCLDVVRGMKVVNAPGRWNPDDLVARYYKDHRTIERFVAEARLRSHRPTMIDFVQRQQFVGPSSLRDAIIRAIRQRQRRDE